MPLIPIPGLPERKSVVRMSWRRDERARWNSSTATAAVGAESPESRPGWRPWGPKARSTRERERARQSFQGEDCPRDRRHVPGQGLPTRGPEPVKGLGGSVDPKTGRSYHIDSQNPFGEPPHVDVNRRKGYRGPLDKKKYE